MVLVRILILVALTLGMMSLNLIDSNVLSVRVLSYHLYYDDTKIAYIEVLYNSDVQVRVVPLIQDLSPWIISLIRKLIAIPSKYRFIVSSVEELINIIGSNIEITEKNVNKVIVKYKIGNIYRLSIYTNGVLTYEENKINNHVLILELIAIIDNNMHNLALIETVPFVLVVLTLAIYAYLKRERLRIL